MPDEQESGQSPGTTVRASGMIGWLGFFLLVFAVAGFAFYLAGDFNQVGQHAGPALATQQAQ